MTVQSSADVLPKLLPVGENGVLVEYAAEISLDVNRQVRQLAAALERDPIPGTVEIVPAYRSLLVYFDPWKIPLPVVIAGIGARAAALSQWPMPEERLFRIPTVYGGEHGPDLDRVAEAAGLSPDEAVELFSQQRYPVYCLGFLCCLAYMGGVPTRLQLPRLATPRTFLPAGSVGVANAQAVILPIDQPSGFHYLGRTFVTMYDPQRFPPTPVRAGDWIECPAVSEAEARRCAGRFLGEFQVHVSARA